MPWVILGFLIVISLGIVVVASLSHVGDEPGAYRFKDLPPDDDPHR